MQGQAPPGQDKEKNRPETNPWPSDGTTNPTDIGPVVDKLEKYFEDILTWGRLVRDDIKKLEARAGLPEGDPGDPPAGPW